MDIAKSSKCDDVLEILNEWAEKNGDKTPSEDLPVHLEDHKAAILKGLDQLKVKELRLAAAKAELVELEELEDKKEKLTRESQEIMGKIQRTEKAISEIKKSSDFLDSEQVLSNACEKYVKLKQHFFCQ